MTLQQLIEAAKKEFEEKFKSYADGGDYHHYELLGEDVIPFLESKIEEAYRTGAEDMKDAMEIKVLTPATEPPPNNLSQNQIFGSGQMNAMMRINEKANAFLNSLNYEL